ncbi:helicase HerA domain-containing protein [Flavobacterium palustre]|uniref:helicase HerA domain-containing protein n=1 Tax=Flavobacterium palustre TaxID=1476463 RepID=UPI00361349F6
MPIGSYVGATRVPCRANMDKLFGHHCAILGSTGSGNRARRSRYPLYFRASMPTEQGTRPCII